MREGGSNSVFAFRLEPWVEFLPWLQFWNRSGCAARQEGGGGENKGERELYHKGVRFLGIRSHATDVFSNYFTWRAFAPSGDC